VPASCKTTQYMLDLVDIIMLYTKKLSIYSTY